MRKFGMRSFVKDKGCQTYTDVQFLFLNKFLGNFELKWVYAAVLRGFPIEIDM
jgi:hypothetical protein